MGLRVLEMRTYDEIRLEPVLSTILLTHYSLLLGSAPPFPNRSSLFLPPHLSASSSRLSRPCRPFKRLWNPCWTFAATWASRQSTSEKRTRCISSTCQSFARCGETLAHCDGQQCQM